MYRKILSLILIAALALLPAACSVSAEERIGEAEGYGGRLRVAVSMDGARITAVRVLEHHETEGVGTMAIEQLPERMVSANSAEVDHVSGATITSNALKTAVRQAMSPTIGSPAETASPMPADAKAGMGTVVTGRIGPGVDERGDPVYSLNFVTAAALFDAEGRILHLDVDQLELASPGASGMASFNGWPAERSDETAFLAEPAAWRTKRELGQSYRLTSGTWAEEMDAFQRLFTGMTVSEVNQWFAVHCSPSTGKPLTENSLDDDAARYSTLTDEQKSALTDLTSTATMSLRGPNGDILTAIQRAWENAR